MPNQNSGSIYRIVCYAILMKRLLNTPLTGIFAVIAITLGIVFTAFFLSVANWTINSSNRVDLANVNFALAEKVALPQKFEAQGEAQKYQSQFRPRQKDTRRFHFTFEGGPLDDTPYTLWVPHSGSNTVVYINNARSGVSRTRQHALPGTGQEVHFYNIPRMQVLPGRNRVDIYVGADPTGSGLGPVYFGPTEMISKQIKRSELVSSTLPTVAYVAALFALILNLLATLTSKGFVKYISLGLACVGLIALYKVGGSWPALMIAIGVAMYAVAVVKDGRLKFANSLFVSTALSGPILLGLRSLGPLNFPDPSIITFSVWLAALPILMLPPFRVILSTLAERRSRLNELEEALDDTKDNLEKEIRRRAVFEERERLTRDIHDGVGGQLLGLLLRLRTGDVPKASITRDLQSGLNDLRLVVDALDHTGNDLGQALSAFRDRATNQLDAAGLSLKWTQVDGLDFEPQGRDGMLNLYRILQEVLNNIIRHANANEVEVEVSTKDQNQTLQIKIQDDGRGRSKNDKSGRGTLNMQRRAEILGGRVSTGSGLREKGHSVTVCLPMSKTEI